MARENKFRDQYNEYEKCLKMWSKSQRRNKTVFHFFKEGKNWIVGGGSPILLLWPLKEFDTKRQNYFPFHYFQLTKTFLSFNYCICKTEPNIYTYLAALIEDM